MDQRNDKPLLTIAIPAYDRVENLERLIRSLNDEGRNFALLVCDDASPDNGIKDMVNKYIKSMPNLSYYRNETNLGYSGNVLKCYELVQTKYVWFICDDDVVIPGSVQRVISKLKKYEPTCAVLGTKWVDPLGRERTAGPDKDIVYRKLEDLGRDYSPIMRMTFVSIDILEKKDNLPSLIKETNYKDNVFVQLTMAVKLLSDRFSLVELNTTSIYRHVGFKYGDFFKFRLVDMLKAVDAIEHKFDIRKFTAFAKRSLPSAFMLYMSQKIGLFVYSKSPSKQTLKNIVKYYGMYSIFVFLFIPIYYVSPSFFVKFVYKVIIICVHGLEDGLNIYYSMVDRAQKDRRKTEFTEYR